MNSDLSTLLTAHPAATERLNAGRGGDYAQAGCYLLAGASIDLRLPPYDVGCRAGEADGLIVDAAAGVVYCHGPAGHVAGRPYGHAVTDVTADAVRAARRIAAHHGIAIARPGMVVHMDDEPHDPGTIIALDEHDGGVPAAVVAWQSGGESTAPLSSLRYHPASENQRVAA